MCDEYLPILYTSEITNEFFTCVRNWYQFFTSVRNWYQFFTPEKKSHQFFTGVTNTYQFFTRQKLSTWEIWAQILDLKIYRNWPYINFTFGKCDVLVPIFLMGVKFTKWEINGSTARLYRQWRKHVILFCNKSLDGSARLSLAPFRRHFETLLTSVFVSTTLDDVTWFFLRQQRKKYM